jgi:hypothetical protein
MLLGLLLLSVQVLLWFRIYAPTSAPDSAMKKENRPAPASSDIAPVTLPFIIGSVLVVGGIVVFSANLRRPQDAPVHPGPKV